MKKQKNSRNETVYWHQGFFSGMEIELRDYRDVLDFESEHELSKRPLRIDVLIIRMKDDREIGTSIAEFYKKHNIIEYKSPGESLSIDDVFKVIGYTGIYKSHADHVNEIPLEDITISIYRHIKPRKLLKQMDSGNATSVIVEHPGIYRIDGLFIVPIRIIVTSELADEYLALKVLTINAAEHDVRGFLEATKSYDSHGDKERAKSIIDISAVANKELFLRMKEDDNMGPGLKELMHDDLEAAWNGGVNKGIEQGINQRDREKIAEMIRNGKTPQAIVEFCNYPQALVLEVQKSMLATH